MYGAGAGTAGGTLAATGATIGSTWLMFAGMIFLGCALIALARPWKKGVRP
jgi:hypothetical protein